MAMMGSFSGRQRRRLAIFVATVLLIAVMGAGWLALRAQSPDDVVPTVSSSPVTTERTQATAEGTAATASSSPASPATRGKAVPRAGSLLDMLQYAPDRLADDSLPLPFVASYADVAGWMTQQGVASPTSLNDPNLAAWERELGALALPTSLATRGTEAIWQTTYGFDLTQVDQVLTIGQAPDSVTILKGRFNVDVLRNAWAGSGYQPVKVEGMTIWSLFPQDRIDLSAPASRPALGSLNNIVLLDDGTLVAAAKLSRLQSVLKVRNGDNSSLADNSDVQRLLSPLSVSDTLISAEIAKGDLLEATSRTVSSTPTLATTTNPGMRAGSPISNETNATAEASTGQTTVQMPEVKLTLIGLQRVSATSATPASSAATPARSAMATPMAGKRADRSEMVMILLLKDDDNVAAARNVISDRLAHERSTVTGLPFANRLVPTSLDVVAASDGTNVLALRANLIEGPADWMKIVETRDLGFAFWVRTP
ncbi:MAG: hypothetical protein ACR2OU_08795 [Thermomicrobiales bacterium]